MVSNDIDSYKSLVEDGIKAMCLIDYVKTREDCNQLLDIIQDSELNISN